MGIPMKRAKQQQRDRKWYALVMSGEATITEIAKTSGHHRNTVSRAVYAI